MDFSGRNQELEALNKLLSRSKPGIAVVYGRRRVGKTELIRQVVEGRAHFSFEGLEGQSKRNQIQAFLMQLAQQTGKDFTSRQVNHWREVFMLLVEQVRGSQQPWCLVLDEFQWLANFRREIVSDLKFVWDQYLSRIEGTTLILCGSIASFMIDKVIKSKALYGRTELTIHLKELSLGETRQLLGKDRGLREVMDARMMLGGVPMYLNLVKDAPSVRLGVQQQAFTPHGYFIGEYERIFVGHFGKHSDYESLVRILAKHPYGLYRIPLANEADLAVGGTLSKRLAELELAGFISSQTPFAKGPASRHVKFFLSDAFMRFHFAFILPNIKAIQMGSRDLFLQTASTGAFHSWMGRAFEYLCMDHSLRIAELLGFSGVRYVAGPYFRPATKTHQGVQMDLLFDRSDQVITLCEMKYQESPVGIDVIAEVEARAAILRELFPRRTIQKVLIVVNEVTRELLGSGYFFRIVKAEELLYS